MIRERKQREKSEGLWGWKARRITRREKTASKNKGNGEFQHKMRKRRVRKPVESPTRVNETNQIYPNGDERPKSKGAMKRTKRRPLAGDLMLLENLKEKWKNERRDQSRDQE